MLACALPPPVGASQAPQEPQGGTRSHQKPSRTSRGPPGGHQEPPGATRSHQEPPGTTRSHHEPPRATRSYKELPGASRSHPEPLGATRSHHFCFGSALLRIRHFSAPRIFQVMRSSEQYLYLTGFWQVLRIWMAFCMSRKLTPENLDFHIGRSWQALGI